MTEEPLIGTLNEGSLHEALKRLYARPGDRFEVPLDGFVVDILRDGGGPEELIIEIQTSGFGSMGRKLDHLLEGRRVLLVHPIAASTTLERAGTRGRRSPKRGSVHDLFEELVAIPTLLDHPNLRLHIVMVEVTKVQIADPAVRRGRGGFRTVDRRLDRIVETHEFADVTDLRALVRGRLPNPFTTADLSVAAGVARPIAQRIAYCFNAANLIDEVGRDRDGKWYRWS